MRCWGQLSEYIYLDYMKRFLQIIASGGLLFIATSFAISWPISMLLWMFVLGDSHENIWNILRFIFLIISVCITIAFISLDLMNKTSKRNRMIRLIFSCSICLLLSLVTIYDEVQSIKGWSPEEAALSVAFSLYPDIKDSLVLEVESREDLPSWTRGPSITYIVLSEGEPVCRVGVCRRYWSYWTNGMYETLKERKLN